MFKISLTSGEGMVTIRIKHGRVELGRGPTTGIMHPGVSRKQAVFVADVEEGTLSVECQGVNAVEVRNERLEQGAQTELLDGDSFRFLARKEMPPYYVRIVRRSLDSQASDCSEVGRGEKARESAARKRSATEGSLGVDEVDAPTAKRMPPPQQLKQKAATAASTSKKAAGFRPWENVLLKKIQEQGVLVQEDGVALIVDAFPKAQWHWLVLPADGSVRDVKSLGREHLPLLERMKARGEARIAEERLKNECAHTTAFRMGFHSVPSLPPLHMHVISTDFNSTSLKTKKHYNSFTTEFFLPLTQVIEMLERTGHIAVDRDAAEAMLKRPMVCHCCALPLKNMSHLKEHLLTHK